MLKIPIGLFSYFRSHGAALHQVTEEEEEEEGLKFSDNVTSALPRSHTRRQSDSVFGQITGRITGRLNCVSARLPSIQETVHGQEDDIGTAGTSYNLQKKRRSQTEQKMLQNESLKLRSAGSRFDWIEGYKNA